MDSSLTYTAFAGETRIASGDVVALLRDLKPWCDAHPGDLTLIFDDATGKQVDFDMRGSLSDVLARVQEPARHGPGRPKLGVVAKEITLLPRHWEWLEQRPQGASAAIRRLIDEARKQSGPAEAKDRTVRMLSALGGNLHGYEEASRALYAGDRAAFEGHTAGWPKDVRAYTLELAAPAFG